MVTPYHTKCEYMYNSVALLLGYNQVFLYPEVLDFLPIYFPHICPYLESPTCFHGKDLIVQSFMYILRTEMQGGGKLMFMPFEIVSICVWLWYFFQKHVVLQLIHNNINSTC